MKLVRHTPFLRALIVLWCVTILNMSFYLAEIKLLRNADKAMIENAKKLLSSVAEEEDCSGSAEKSSSASEEDLISHQHVVRTILHKNTDVTILLHLAEAMNPDGGFFETFSPPPEV